MQIFGALTVTPREAHMDDVYEVDRIIGRRVSIARKTEYLIYWKGYDMNECSWVGDDDLECPGAVEQFEQECFRLRKQRQLNPNAESIDYYDNNGMATLIDVGKEIFANGVSPFYDMMDDFSFAATANNSEGVSPRLGSSTGRDRRIMVASNGWNRLKREPNFKGRIVQIRGAISDAPGNVYYLSEWDDGKSTWESPKAFDRSLSVLTKFENSCYMRERQSLVRLFQQSRASADPSIMQTREPKYMLEKVHARDGSHPRSDRLSKLSSADENDSSLIDLSTSVLLSGDSAPSNAKESAIKPKQSSHLRQLSSGSSSSGASDIPLAAIMDGDLPKRRRVSAHVFIDHVEGSMAKRRRLEKIQQRELMTDSDDNDVVGVARTAQAAEEPAKVSTMERATDAKCGVCQLEDNVQLASAQEGYTCGECNIAYHKTCYIKLAERLKLDPVYIASLKHPDPGFVCWFCHEYGTLSVEEFLTWRIDSSSPATSLAHRIGLLGKVDVIVKWKGISYRRLSWVPYVWLSTTRRSVTLRNMKLQIQMNVPAPLLSKCVNDDYYHPACIIGVKPAEPWLQSRREQQLREGRTKVARNAWELFTSYEKVWVAWRGLDISSATWEVPPSPLEDEADYAEWNDVFMAWKHAEMVSLAERRVKQMYFTRYSTQPSFVAGGTMKDYQMEGAQWLFQRWRQRESAVLADEMGMGKTIQTIVFLLMVYHMSIEPGLGITDAIASNTGTFPFLVVVPTTLVDNWMREFRLWAPSLVVAQLSGRSASREVQMKHTLFRTVHGRRDLKCHVVLTSYEALNNPAGAEAMAKITWQAMIVDEGHRLKNDQTKTFQTLQKFRSRMRVLLTGTPLQNNLGELHSVMSFVDPNKFKPGDDSMLSAETAADIERTKDAVRPYILRRTKADLPNLVPPRYEVILPVSMTGLQRKLYRATLTRNVALLRDIATAIHAHDDDVSSTPASETDAGGRLRSSGTKKPTQLKKTRVSSLNNILVEVRRILSHPYGVPEVEPEFPTEEEKHRHLIEACGKLKLFHVLLTELRRRGHRVLLFAQFKDTLSILEDYLDGEGVGYERIDGDTPSFLRQTRVSAFNAPDSTSTVFLSSTRTGGLGINLTSADVVVIYDCDYNPHADLQAMARAHRIGQTKPVYVFKLVTQDTAEERIVEMATRKLLLDQLVIQSIDETLDSQQKQQQQHPGELEQALRHGASLLFDATAEKQAEERAIVYDSTRVQQLLDQCQEAVKVEQEKQKEKQASTAAADFSRVWTLDRNGHMNAASADVTEEKEPEDIWEQLLEKTGEQAASAKPYAMLSTEDINGRLLRARRHKVDYAEGVSLKKQQQKQKDTQDDSEWAENLNEEDEEDLNVEQQLTQEQMKTQQSMQPILVTKDDFLAIVNMHRSRQIATYLEEDQKLPPMAAVHAQDVVSQFEAISHRTQLFSGTIPGDGSPRLFFPIPANLRLRNKAQLPEQPTSSSCPICAGVRSHKRDYCPYISDPQFMAGIENIKRIPHYWRHPYYHNFVVWYIIQYMWFVLGHPQGEAVHQQNVQKWPEYGMDAKLFMPEVRAIRERRAQAQAARRQQHVQLQALRGQQLYRNYQNFYRTFELTSGDFDTIGESQSPRETAVRNYMLYSKDSEPYRRFCNVLTTQPVNFQQVNNREWLKVHLKWLYNYRMQVLQATRQMPRGKVGINSMYTNSMSLRFISMRIEQVRLRIRQLNERPVQLLYKPQRAAPASVVPAPLGIAASSGSASEGMPASMAPLSTVPVSAASSPVATPAPVVSSPAAKPSSLASALAAKPAAAAPLPASIPVAKSATAAFTPLVTPASAALASSALPPSPASAPAAATTNGSSTSNSTAPLSSVEIYTYIRLLGDLKTTINTSDFSTDDQNWLTQLIQYMEELRGYLVNILSDINMGSPALDHAVRLLNMMVDEHQELVAKGPSSGDTLAASKDVNFAILKLWSRVKGSLQNSKTVPVSSDAKTTPNSPSMRPSVQRTPQVVSQSNSSAGRDAAAVSSPQIAAAQSVSVRPNALAAVTRPVASTSNVSTAVSPMSSSHQQSPSVAQSGIEISQERYNADVVTPSTLPEFPMRSQYSTVSLPDSTMQPPAYSYQHPTSAMTTTAITAATAMTTTAMPMQAANQYYQSGIRNAPYNISAASSAGYSPAKFVNAMQMNGISNQQQVPANMLALSAQQAELLVIQQRQQQQQQQQYYNAQVKAAPPPMLLTPPNSSNFMQPQQSINSFPLMNQSSSSMAPVTASFDLACLLCDDPGHQSSNCPFRKDIRVLTRRRVAIDDNHALAPGIRETTLNIIDLYIQKAYADK
ncbi:hypothetical protein IWW36_001670 [Coemansia brasiliensis]|uniref:Uncharacterized protein n=1 Tax=Coemansia brasiliensis TaxID=2650707 RepID=A0A9W8I985_9FUNG|nr:hypothetical protein IWW36_001670 [Coemansia brasiliensis]